MKRVANVLQMFSLTTFMFAFPSLAGPMQSQITCAVNIIVQPGDTLSSLATQYLGDLTAYGTIIEATNTQAVTDESYARIENANQLSIGWKLCLPDQDSSQSAIEIQSTKTKTLPIPSSMDLPSTQHPLSIETARQRDYPGSAITIEEILRPKSNYQPYITSYQSDGLKIYAFMTIPSGEPPATGWPIILFNHGYIPPEQYQTTAYYVDYVDRLARNGYIVFQPDYRGHGRSEGEPTGLYMTPDYVTDVLNALASIKRYPNADPERIGMWGHSMGGYITLRAMVTTQDIKASVIWAGVVGSYEEMVNWWDVRRSLALIQPRLWREDIESAFGTWEENPIFWETISATTYLDDLSGPIQLHHATTDLVVPVTFSKNLNERLKMVENPAEYYTYDGDDHNLSINFSPAMTRTITFFDTYIKTTD
ncbi:MAG: alpha/beta fold hydrolase [Chloroflexota bacterium]